MSARAASRLAPDGALNGYAQDGQDGAAAQQRQTERLSEEKTPYKGDAQNGTDA